MSKTVKVARNRNTPYRFNFVTNGGSKSYVWAGSKGNRIDVKELPIEAVDWLQMNSVTFRKGELVIIPDSAEAVEALSNLGGDKEEYDQNTHSKQDIVNFLNEHHMKLKKKLESITVDSEKRFVLDVAKEVSDDLSHAKIQIISEWAGIASDILFAKED